MQEYDRRYLLDKSLDDKERREIEENELPCILDDYYYCNHCSNCNKIQNNTKGNMGKV